jgi:PAS domain S-box-containing protein
MPRNPLAASDQTYRLLVEAVVDYAIFLLDPEGRVRSWNPGAQRLKGYTPEEIVGRPFSTFFTEEDRRLGRPEAILEAARRDGRAESEGWRVRKDGTCFWALAVLDAVRDHDGRVIGFAKVTRDITERRAAQQALVESERRFRLLVQGVIDYAIFMLDPSGRVAEWNAGARRIKGYEAQEIIGQHFSRFYTEEDRSAGVPQRALEQARTEGRFEAEGWRVRKDGSRFWASVVIDAIRDEDGTLVGFAKITRDITERREAQQALIDSERRFRLLVQGVIDYAIFMLDLGGRVVNWNAGARRIKGYEAQEIIGQHFSRFYTEEDRATGVPQRALEQARTEGRFEAEGWRVRKDGSRFWASVVIDAIRDEDGILVGFAKVTRDITDRHEAQRAAEEARERMAEMQRLEALAELAGGVAHNYSNLIQIVLSGIRLANAVAGENDRLRHILADIGAAAEKRAGVTEHLLAFSRDLPTSPEIIDTAKEVAEVVDLLGHSLPASIRIDLDLVDDLWPIRVDAAQFELALLNVALNARDAMPEGGLLAISAENVVLHEGPTGLAGRVVAIRLRDTGTGISKEVLGRVCEPFFTTKPRGRSTGLGLSQAHGFAEQAGGTLRIISAPGRGTEVTVFLPAATVEAGQESPFGCPAPEG